ncbi:MAG: DnaJ domain-containing protein [Nitrososphaerales archaeon]|jgi:hypothetical protein
MELEKCYRILGVRQDADISEIKSAFRALAREFHPDRNKSPGAEEKFNAITEAYSTILKSPGVPVRARGGRRRDTAEEEYGGRLSFTIFADKEIVHSVSPRLFEREIRKRFNSSLSAGTACKIGNTWFEIDVDAPNRIPLIGSRLRKRKILIEWYKAADGSDKWKLTTWENFWAFVRRLVSLAAI